MSAQIKTRSQLDSILTFCRTHSVRMAVVQDGQVVALGEYSENGKLCPIGEWTILSSLQDARDWMGY
jgi:hypothetical protein